MNALPSKDFSRRRSWLKRILGGVAGLVAVWLLLSFLAAYELTRRLRPPFPEPVPAAAAGRIEAHRLHTVDGEDLGCWFLPGPDDGPSVVVLHGIGDCRSSALPLAELYVGEGCSVVAPSLRASGDSSGERHDAGYSARHDVVAAVEFLEARRPGRPIVVQGNSLGTAAAIFAARELGTRVSGYVLEEPYRDLRTAVRTRVEAALPPLLARIAYCGLVTVSPLVLPDLDRIAPVERIGDIPESLPILLLAGGSDVLARPEEARAVYERVASHARLVFFEGAGHEWLYRRDPALYRAEVGRLLRQATGRGS